MPKFIVLALLLFSGTGGNPDTVVPKGVCPVSGPATDGLKEFSVVYTDRALNHMSAKFQHVMVDLHEILTSTYGAESAILVPGGGSFAMEAVARQFTPSDGKVLVIRNGYFSYRWTQIFDQTKVADHSVFKARPDTERGFAPVPVEEVIAEIERVKPKMVFSPHVETSAGIILPNDYLQKLGDAVRRVGGIFVLDCVASGTLWVDMSKLPVDVLITAPQKGWSGPASTGIVMLGKRGVEALKDSQSDSFVLDLKKWHGVMDAYLKGGHAYHATMATDAIAAFHHAALEMKQVGMEKLRQAQIELGRKVRELLAERGYLSVAAKGFESPTVVVVYTEDATIAKKFAGAGLQIAAGVPLMVDHGTNEISKDFNTFRLGLFGLDKLNDVDGTVKTLRLAIGHIRGDTLATAEL